jgi:hypothetical protein
MPALAQCIPRDHGVGKWCNAFWVGRRLRYSSRASAETIFAEPLEDSFAVPSERDACMKEFVPLREKAGARGRLIKVASERHAPPEEACKLIRNFGQSEARMIKYVGVNSARCGIPSQISDQLKAGHKNTEIMQKKVCDMAQQVMQRGPAGPVGDFDHIGAPPLVPWRF